MRLQCERWLVIITLAWFSLLWSVSSYNTQDSRVYTVQNFAILDEFERTYFEIIEPASLKYLFRIYPAKDFGTQFKDGRGKKRLKLVLADPEDGCSPLKNGLQLKGQAALVLRKGCSFVSKAFNAQSVGSELLIVTEQVENSEALDMIDDKTQRHISIPAGFLPGNSGLHLIKVLRAPSMQDQVIIEVPVNISTTDVLLKQPPWTLW